MATNLNASVHRDTEHELVTLRQRANAFEVGCVERGVFGTAPSVLPLHEDLFTDEELSQVIFPALRLFEEKYKIARAQYDTSPSAHNARLAAMMRANQQAEKALADAEAAQAIQAAAEAEHARLSLEIAQMKAAAEAAKRAPADVAVKPVDPKKSRGAKKRRHAA